MRTWLHPQAVLWDMPVGNPVFFSYACRDSWTITGNPVALCDTQHAAKETVTRPMSEYFANDPECHNLLRTAATQGRRIGEMSHTAACRWSHILVDSGPVALCGPVALYLLPLLPLPLPLPEPLATLPRALKGQKLAAFNLGWRLPFRMFRIEIDV